MGRADLVEKTVGQIIKQEKQSDLCPVCGGVLVYTESPFQNELGEPEKVGYKCEECRYERIS